MVGVKYIASVSFGKDSLAMLLRLLEEQRPLDAVVFYDTGMEFQAIYNIRDRVVQLLNNSGITYVELHPDESFRYSMLEREVKYRDGSGVHYGYGWCGGVCRWHTSMKLEASYDRALALQCAELISQLMHDHEDDLVHFYQEVLRELGCDVRVERTKIPEFTGSAFHMVPAVKHTITNKEGYHKEITYL